MTRSPQPEPVKQMHEGKLFQRVGAEFAVSDTLLVSIFNHQGKVVGIVGRRVSTGNSFEEEFYSDPKAALDYAVAEIGAPGVERVVVYVEADDMWDDAWGKLISLPGLG